MYLDEFLQILLALKTIFQMCAWKICVHTYFEKNEVTVGITLYFANIE